MNRSSLSLRQHGREHCRWFVSGFAATVSYFGATVLAQTEVATEPVGFTSVIVAPGAASALSLPLNNRPVYHGVVSSLANNTIQTGHANWAVNAYGPFNIRPHVVRLLSGTSQGRQFKVVSNSADTLTLISDEGSLTTLIATGDQYEILPVATLATLFGATAPKLLVNPDPESADNVLVRGAFGWLTYYNDGTQWLRQGAGRTNQNNVPILPEQGLLLVRRANSAMGFMVKGVAPTTNLKTDLPADKVTFLGNRFPINSSLTKLKLDDVAGWRSNVNPAAADTVLMRESSGWVTYFHNGSTWVKQGGGSTPQNPVIPYGVSVLVVREAGVSLTLDQPLPY